MESKIRHLLLCALFKILHCPGYSTSNYAWVARVCVAFEHLLGLDWLPEMRWRHWRRPDLQTLSNCHPDEHSRGDDQSRETQPIKVDKIIFWNGSFSSTFVEELISWIVWRISLQFGRIWTWIGRVEDGHSEYFQDRHQAKIYWKFCNFRIL